MTGLRSFFFSLAAFIGSSLWAAPHFDVRASRLQSFLQFIDLLNDPRASSKLKDLFLGSAYNNSKFQKLLAEYEDLQRLEFLETSVGDVRKSILWSQSLFAKNLEDFSLRTLGVLPAKSQERIFALFAEFLPVYERLFWEKYSEKSDRVRYNLEGTLNNWHLGAVFDSQLKFLHASWPNETSFYISLVPVPESKGFLGTEYFQIGLALRYGLDDYSPKDLFAPLLRAIARSLMRNQSKDYQLELESDFQSLSSLRHSVFARDQFDEQIALALAYFYTEKNGYSFTLNHEISEPGEKAFTIALAKELGVLLSRDRAMNRDFIQKYVALYKEYFPDAIYERNNIFRHVAILSDDESIRSQRPQDNVGQIVEKSQVELLSLSLDRGQVLKAGDPRSVVVILLDQNIAASQKNFTLNPFMSSAYKKLRKSPGSVLLRSFDSSGRAFYFLKLRKADQLAKALEKLKDASGKDEALIRL